MSIPQMHQLAGQVKALRRIRDQLKCISQSQTFHYHPSASFAPSKLTVSLSHNNFVTAHGRAQNAGAGHSQLSRKPVPTPKAKSASKRKRYCSVIDMSIWAAALHH